MNIQLVSPLLLIVACLLGGAVTSPRGGQASDNDLKQLSELLLRKDVTNEHGEVRVNTQFKVPYNGPITDSPNPLLQYTVSSNSRSQPQTYRFLQQLFKEYERNSPNLKRAQQSFLDKVLESDVMIEALRFLNSHGVAMSKNGLKSYLDKIWFTTYNRGRGVQSSGFKHVFLAEIKNNQVQGLHNWLFYLDQESKGLINYVGYSKYLNFRGYPSSIIKMRYQWNGSTKPAGSMFVGTSPELEMALYSVCFMFRQSQDCNLSLGNINVNIKTHSFVWNKESLIGSAYPTI